MGISKTKLKKHGGAWKAANAREKTGGFADLEPGLYLAAITSAVLDEFGQNNKLAVQFVFTVQEGESEGQTQSSFDNLETEDNMYWFQNKLSKLGYELPDDISEMPEILEDIEANRPIVKIKVVEKDGYTNVYLNKLVEESGGLTAKEIKGEEEEAPSKDKAKPSAKAKAKAKAKAEKVEAELEVGDRVTFVDEGNTFTGTVKEVNGDEQSCDVEVDDVDEVWDVDFNDLTKLEGDEAPADTEEEEEAAFEVGQTVSFETEDEVELEGVITEIDDDGYTVKTEDYEDDELNDEWVLEESDLTAVE
jgi:transcription antitermination factor NusG